MFRYALRRVLWAIPTLFATSLILFVVTTLAPDPPLSVDGDGLTDEPARARFLDLPRFVNTHPDDVRSRAEEAARHVASADTRREAAARRLEHLGGAALPYVLPILEALPPVQRQELAVALMPVAVRMELPGATDVDLPDGAVLFWTRFRDDRALDFTQAAVSRAVDRLVEHGSSLRESDLVSLDTFALADLVRAMMTTDDPVALERLTRLARHAAGRGPVLTWQGAVANGIDLRRVRADWKEWWFVHATDFATINAVARPFAVITETRYGKWLKRAASGELGVSATDGEPISQKLRARAPITLMVCALAMLWSLALAVPIGALGAWHRGGAFDVASSVVLFVLYAIPTFAVAEVLERAAVGHSEQEAPLALAVAALTVGSLATISRWQRTAMLDVVRQDFIRTAKAKGLPAWRIALVHALRNALLPTMTLAGMHLPVVFGGAIVVEEVFGLRGVGYETLRAIETHDNAWLMAVVLASAVAITLGMVASDIACGMLDPRVREVLMRQQARRET